MYYSATKLLTKRFSCVSVYVRTALTRLPGSPGSPLSPLGPPEGPYGHKETHVNNMAVSRGSSAARKQTLIVLPSGAFCQHGSICTVVLRYSQGVLDSLDHLGGREVLGRPLDQT